MGGFAMKTFKTKIIVIASLIIGVSIIGFIVS